MSTRTARRRLIALALGLVTLAAPAAASASDLRGEYARDVGTAAQATGVADARGIDARGEFAQSAAQPAQPIHGTDVRGEFAKPEYRGTPSTQVAPADGIDPADAPSSLPYVVSGLVLLLGFTAIAIVVSLRRRVRITH
jgi:hypothetical protein